MADEQTDLLREIRDLLRVVAEPALAERDKKFRAVLVELAGKSKGKRKAVLLMDGSRTQKEIEKEADIDQGALSRLIKALRSSNLLPADDKQLKLAISVPPNLFQSGEED